MNYLNRITVTCLLAFSPLASRAQDPAVTGLAPLFDGKTLQGWVNPYSYGKAEVVDGVIQLTADNKFFLITEKKYANFVFEGEVKLPEGQANSGFMFRAQVKETPDKKDPTKKKVQVYGYQAEVDGSARGWSGGLYDEGRRMWFVSPVKGNPASEAEFKKRAGATFKRNDWNTYRITCQGAKIKIEVNGVVTSEFEDTMDKEGPIGIQHHGEKGAVYQFRNLKLKELK